MAAYGNSASPVTLSKLKFKKRLGQGAFGEVWHCAWRAAEGERMVAVKRVALGSVRQSGLLEQLRREVRLMRTLKHPHIVECFFDFRDSRHLFLGMELAEVGMYDKLSKVGQFSLQDSARYFWQLCDALVYLHGLSPCVIHRDIKPENVLLDHEGCAKLCDFGWSALMNQAGLRGTFCGTPEYLAPEMVKNTGHDEKVDIWCMGILLFEMALGRSPFSSRKQADVRRKILKLDFKFPASAVPRLRDLILKLCQSMPRERPTALEAREDAFVAGYVDPPRGRALPDTDPVDEALELLQEQSALAQELRLLHEAGAQGDRQLAEARGELEAMQRQLGTEQRGREQAEQELALLGAGAAKQRTALEQLHPLRPQAGAQRLRRGG